MYNIKKNETPRLGKNRDMSIEINIPLLSIRLDSEGRIINTRQDKTYSLHLEFKR